VYRNRELMAERAMFDDFDQLYVLTDGTLRKDRMDDFDLVICKS
jgi:hypothetical protein